jgi:hypothetical protein
MLGQKQPVGTPEAWPVQRLLGRTSSATYRHYETDEWSPQRVDLHDEIINRLLARSTPQKASTIWIVLGGVGSGKSTLIQSKIAPEHQDAVVIDADRLWLDIPEYEALAAADWRTAGDRTYQELRSLRDELLAEACVRRLDIILETTGSDDAFEGIVTFLNQTGYQVSLEFVDCPVEVAKQRMEERANLNPTPEVNLWTSPPRPEFPDKYEYQNINAATLRQEYEKRKNRWQPTHLHSEQLAGSRAEVAKINEWRQCYGVTRDEWASVLRNSGITEAQWALMQNDQRALAEDEKLTLRLALAYLFECRLDTAAERLAPPDALISLSWPEFKSWQRSGLDRGEFYTSVIKPQRAARGAQVGDTLWDKKNGQCLRVDAVEDGVAFNFMRYDPHDKRLVGSWRSLIGHAVGPKRTFTLVSLWTGAGWIDCEPIWEEATDPPQSLLKRFMLHYEDKITLARTS